MTAAPGKDGILEMEPEHRERVVRLMNETAMKGDHGMRAQFLSAYTAVLLKDILLTLDAMLPPEEPPT